MAEQKEKLWNKNYCKVMTANLSLYFAFYMLTPLLPLYLSEHFHATKDMIGLVLSGYSVTAMLFRPFSGYIVDNFQRKNVLLLMFFIFFIFYAGYLVAGSLMLFAIVRTLHGAPFGGVTVASSTVAIDVLPSSRRNEGIGYYGLANNVAMALAPSVAIFIYQYVKNFDVIFAIAMAIAAIGLGVNATLDLKPRPLNKNNRKISLDRFILIKGLWLGGNMVAFGFCFGVLSNYLAIYGKEVMHITAGTGVYFLILATGLIASRLQGAKALREGRLTYNAGMGMCISLVGYFIFIAFPNAFGYYGSALLIGLGNGHMWPAFQNMTINVATHEQRGTANSTILISWDIGMGIGCLLGGVIADWVSYGAAFWTVVAINAMGVAMFFIYTMHHFRRNKLR